MEEDIKAFLNIYETAKSKGDTSYNVGISYSALNKSFYFEVEDKNYKITFNKLADHPGVGDKKADEIKAWAR